jgi:hypothetical protein
VNRARFICPSFVRPDSNSNWWKNSAAGHDKSAPDAPVNETKLRLQSEFKNGPGVAWITQGREIENYVDHGVLQTAVRTVHPQSYGGPSLGGAFDHALYFKHTDQIAVMRSIDKVKVARLVCAEAVDLNILDLKARLEELVQMIRSANAI